MLVGGGGGGGGTGLGGKGWEEVGSGDVLLWSLPGCVYATLILGTKKLQFLKPLFVYLRSLGVLKNLFKWVRALIQIESKFVGF